MRSLFFFRHGMPVYEVWFCRFPFWPCLCHWNPGTHRPSNRSCHDLYDAYLEPRIKTKLLMQFWSKRSVPTHRNHQLPTNHHCSESWTCLEWGWRPLPNLRTAKRDRERLESSAIPAASTLKRSKECLLVVFIYLKASKQHPNRSSVSKWSNQLEVDQNKLSNATTYMAGPSEKTPVFNSLTLTR